MIRVLHVVVAGELGGAEHMLRDLAAPGGSTVASHVVAVLSPTPALARFFTDAGLAVRDGGQVREDALSQVVRSFGGGATRWLLATTRAVAPDVVHLHTFASQVPGTRVARSLGARVVRTEHSTRVYDDPSCWPFSRWSLARTDAVVAISAHVRDAAIARAPWIADRIRVVPNGVDTERFAPRASTPHPRFRFVLVGRLEPRKGVDVALRALADVPDVGLDVVGDGEERSRLETLARELGVASRVHFHGYLADPRPVLAAADAAVASSRKEGLGIAFLEAMAMGLPLVTVPVGGLVEIVKDGETGLVSREASPTSLTDAMRVMARDRARARELGARARGDVVARYSLEAMRRGYDHVYERCVDRPRSEPSLDASVHSR